MSSEQDFSDQGIKLYPLSPHFWKLQCLTFVWTFIVFFISGGLSENQQKEVRPAIYKCGGWGGGQFVPIVLYQSYSHFRTSTLQ